MTEEQLYEDIELSKAISEAEKLAHEVRSAELAAARAEYELLETRINMEYQLTGAFEFHRVVDQKSMNKLCRQIRVWHKHDPAGEWEISMNSVGGDLYAGVGIVDELISRSLRGGGTHKITVKVRGLAASAAGIILQAADDRVIGPNSQLMIHKGSSGVYGSVDQIADEHEWWQRSVDQMVSLFLSRTDRIDREEFLFNIDRRDWYLSAEEAVELGFADRIG